MSDGSSRLKIARLVDRHGLSDLDSQLAVRYEDDGDSLRDLAAFVNVEVTKAFLVDLPFSPEAVYRTLANPDGTSSKRDQSDLRRRLRTHDVDVAELESEWVTHMTVRSYLQRHLGMNTERNTQAPLDPAITLDRLRGLLEREREIIRRSVDATEGVDGDRWDIHQEVRLIDRETGESHYLREFLQGLDPKQDDV